ncbi:MAG: hypothetical protein QF567_03355, partial [Candidatus Pacearchaeota archaeon]|nr:hypothetical protein [Candidatus Pacearchaeota archaeon]
QEELLYHVCDKIEFEKIKFDAHIFYNEKAAIDYKHYLYKVVLEIEEEIKKNKKQTKIKTQKNTKNNKKTQIKNTQKKQTKTQHKNMKSKQ